jgi:acetyl esterase/lipase
MTQSGQISWQAKLLLAALAFQKNRRMGPQLPAANVRRRLRRLEPFVPGPPKQTVTTAVDADGISVVRVEVQTARPDRSVLFFHGGGYMLGTARLYRDFIWRIGAAARAIVYYFDYRLAPEHPFPAALEDIAFAIGWAAANARRWNGDGRRIAIGGDSSGANLALGVLVSIAPELRAVVRAALLFYGVYDLRATAARTRAIAGLQQQLKSYLSGSEDLFDDPRASPLKAVAPGLFPPCFVIGAGTDTWCLHDSLTLAQALSAAESSYELHVMEGMPHGFMQMGALDGRRAVMRLMQEFLARNV